MEMEKTEERKKITQTHIFNATVDQKKKVTDLAQRDSQLKPRGPDDVIMKHEWQRFWPKTNFKILKIYLTQDRCKR